LVRRKHRQRDLPQHLRPLAALVDLANLLHDEQIERLHRAQQRELEANGELIARASSALGRSNLKIPVLKEQVKSSAAELQHILEDFSASVRAPGFKDQMVVLLERMRLSEYARSIEMNPGSLFHTLAIVRSTLRTVAQNLHLRDDIVRLPKECYSPPAVLRRVDERIKVTVVPVSHWLLPMIDGLEATRLGICDACHMLYVARRRDQLGCSRKCGDTLYMRRYRRSEYRNRSKPTTSAIRSARHRTSSRRKVR